MNFLIKECSTENDYESFAKLSFDTLVSIRGLPPETSREEFYEWAKGWLKDFIDQLELNKIFIAIDDHGDYAGHIWLSLEEDLLPWEFEKYFWIQNITVEKRFRNQGLGKKLMNYAEKLITSQKGKNIGLHVNIESQAAISLYRKLKYTEYKTQFIKNIKLAFQHSFSERQPSRNVYVKRIEKIDELDSLRTIIFNSFKIKLRSEAQNNIILIKFDKYFNNLKQNKNDYQFFKILNKNKNICGYFITSIGEWRYDDCVIIKDIGVIETSHEKDLLYKIYNFIEEWTQNQNINLIQIVLMNKEINLINFFKENDFEIVGYFMQKKFF